MNSDSYMIVRLTPDQKQYTYWVIDGQAGGGLPREPLQALGNRTTVKATLGTAIQNELPTLST